MLSLIWKHKSKYNVIDEDVILENTFTQQTSGGENLWKTQLGITENYLIILKCELDVSAKDSYFTSNSRIIIHMAPLNRLEVNKCPGRRLEILFPNGCNSFYKLITSDECGYAWVQWRRLKELCVEDTRFFAPHWVLIPFGRLEAKVQQYLRNEQFLRPIRIELNRLDLIGCKDAKPLFTHTFKARNIADGQKPDAAEIHKSSEKMNGYYSPHSPKKRRNKQRRTRQVNRFGEGVAEGCSLSLYLSCDVSSFEDLRLTKPKINLVPKLSKTVLESFGDMSKQKMALEYIHRLEQKIEDGRRKEKTLIRTPIIEHSEKDEDELKNKTDAEVRLTLKTASHFRIDSSPFFVSKGIRQSRSVDALTKIGSYIHEYGYLTTNLSLPNLNELAFYRRNHRLSYSADFDDERTEPAIPISFWISNNIQGRYRTGRFFSVNPVNQKSEAIRRRTLLRKSHSLKSNMMNSIIARDKETRDDSKSWTSSGYFVKKIIQDIHNEYPIRHSLWTESPNKKYKETSTDDSTGRVKGKNANLEDKSKNKTSNKICRRVKDVNPHQLARELRRIQLLLFCQMENGEIARLILNPGSVTEVNCPYLFGYLHFFERIGDMVVSELLAECKDTAMADSVCYFIQVAHYCIKMRDKQSSYAILKGLCNSAVMKSTGAWPIIHQCYRNELRLFQRLLNTNWKKTDTHTTNSNIPVFKSFLNMLFETLLQKKEEFSSTNSGLKKLWIRLSRLLDDDNRKQNSLMNRVIHYLLSVRNSQEKKSVLGNRHNYEELVISSYEHLEELLAAIEECRQNYCFTIQYVPFQEEIRHLLLSKQYMM